MKHVIIICLFLTACTSHKSNLTVDELKANVTAYEDSARMETKIAQQYFDSAVQAKDNGDTANRYRLGDSAKVHSAKVKFYSAQATENLAEINKHRGKKAIKK